MRLICGFLRLDGGPADPATAAAMAQAMTPPGLGPALGLRADGPAALAVLRFGEGGGPEEGFAEEAGAILAADLRLDRPREVAAALGRPPAAAPEALALAAVVRWGEAVPDRLDGDYALAAWNPDNRRLTLTRDIFGTRPLCTALLPGRLFAFASLPKGLHGSGLIPPRPDLTALGRLVLAIYDVSEATGYRDIAWLPAGHVMTVAADGAARTVRGWRPDPAAVGVWRGTHAEAADTLRGLIREAVEARIPASGGVAGHLSGGLDSSAVGVLAARRLRQTGRDLSAIAFLAGPDAAPGADPDRPLVEALLAQGEAIACTESYLHPDDTLADADADVPVTGHEIANHAKTCAMAAASGAGVLLTGAGGDEGATYNGAHIHADLLRTGHWRALAADLPARARREGRPLSRVVLQRLIRPFLPAWIRQAEARLRGWSRPVGTDALALLAPNLRKAVVDSMIPTSQVRSNSPEDRVATFRDGFLPHRNTVWAVLGASHGLAFAHPLLDRRVVDFALGLPLERFLHGGHSRQPFRDAMAGILPDPVRLAGMKGAALPNAGRIVAAAKPALLAEAASLRGGDAAAILDLDALDAAFAALPDRPGAHDPLHHRQAAAATRALSLARHLSRLG